MKNTIYFAPLEGITGHVYRDAHRKYFGNIDKYFIPFLVTNQTGKLKSKERKDILPENNQGIYAVPQILSNNAKQFIMMAKFLEGYGYKEININLGCPARTVVTKKRGSGFLAFPEELDRFLEEVYDGISVKLSVKTRIGLDSPEEFEELLKIYNQYPIEELIIHPRVQKDFYKNTPNWDVFEQAVKESKNPVCYNGDINTTGDLAKLQQRFPDINCIMLGRGLLRNPGFADEIQEGKALDKNVLKAFHDELCAGYEQAVSGDKNVLFKMKEVWFYMGQMFEDSEKYVKAIRKSNRLGEYYEAVEKLFGERNIRKV